MVKIIETNMIFSMHEEGIPSDIQSRVIEVKDWHDYTNEIRFAKQVSRHSLIGNMYGASIPKNAKILHIDINEDRLICKFKYFDSAVGIKTAYIIQ